LLTWTLDDFMSSRLLEGSRIFGSSSELETLLRGESRRMSCFAPTPV
jgi:hypothetical protein